MKYLDLVFGIICLLTIGYSFYTGGSTKSILGLSWNIWVYRLLYVLIAALCFYDYFEKRKKA